MRLVVTGTRHGRSDLWWWLNRFVAKHGRPELCILGDAQGVDEQAWLWTLFYKVEHVKFEAQWRAGYRHAYNPRAGHERNQVMVDQASRGDWCLAFPHPTKPSPGTWDCYRRALDRGLNVAVCKWRGGTPLNRELGMV